MVWGTGENMHLVERFTRVNNNTIDYQFTLTDPTTFSRPFTASIPMTSLDGRMYEYACHEGNYGMTNILSAARNLEKQARGSER